MSQQNKNNVESNALPSGSPTGPMNGGQTSGFTSGGLTQASVVGNSQGNLTQPLSSQASQAQNFRRNVSDNKQEVVSITYEEIGLFPRSFSRVLDRFLKQVFSDVENLVIQEYRFYRYLFLTTFKSLLILFFVPFFVNFLAKNYVVRPLTEYFWNTKQTEIFLNSYQQKRAFAELKDFEEKLYFESLIYPKSPERATSHQVSLGPMPPQAPSVQNGTSSVETVMVSSSPELSSNKTNIINPGTYSESVSQQVVRFAPQAPAANSKSEGLTTGDGDKSKVVYSVPVLNSTNELNFTAQGESAQPQKLYTTEGNVSVNNVNNKDQLNTLFSSSPQANEVPSTTAPKGNLISVSDEKTESLINSYTLKSSLFVYQTREADKNIQQRYQEKTIELAQRYNDQSIEAITNFFADLISLLTLFYLLYALEIQINITKSFLLEVFFGLDDSKKSLLILLVTDLLVGYHSSNLWELFFEFLFNHYGLPESQTGIFLLVATLPVLLDVLFKYLIFRHLNRSSPATVATYQAIIE